jgi:hypothetical protein
MLSLNQVIEIRESILAYLNAGVSCENTIEKSELYYNKKATYYTLFDKCDRVEDYKVAWGILRRFLKKI